MRNMKNRIINLLSEGNKLNSILTSLSTDTIQGEKERGGEWERERGGERG